MFPTSLHAMASLWRRALPAAALLLGACSILPTYEPKAADATISFVGIGRPSFCSRAGRFSLDVIEADGYRTAKVPVGERISVWNYMSFDGYNVISTCMPMLAFTPAAGKSYILNAGLADGKCFIELVREDKSRDTGVALEPSMAQPGC